MLECLLHRHRLNLLVMSAIVADKRVRLRVDISAAMDAAFDAGYAWFVGRVLVHDDACRGQLLCDWWANGGKSACLDAVVCNGEHVFLALLIIKRITSGATLDKEQACISTISCLGHTSWHVRRLAASMLSQDQIFSLCEKVVVSNKANSVHGLLLALSNLGHDLDETLRIALKKRWRNCKPILALL